MNIRKIRNTQFSVGIGLIFKTCNAQNLLSYKYLNSLEQEFQKICSGMNCDLTEFSGHTSYVSIVVSLAPKISVSQLVNALKGASSRMLQKQHPELANILLQTNTVWDKGYFAYSKGDADGIKIQEYIANTHVPVQLTPPASCDSNPSV